MDEYQELREAAADALRTLLRHTEPGTGVYLHTAYAALRAEVEAAKPKPPPAPKKEPDHWAVERANRLKWRLMPRDQREMLVIEILGDRSMTVKEVNEAIVVQLGDGAVYYGPIRSLLQGLLSAGEVSRRDTPYRGRTIAKYSRKTDLSGPIADLEREYHGTDKRRAA